jgi:hypothetical protein
MIAAIEHLPFLIKASMASTFPTKVVLAKQSNDDGHVL